MLGRVAIPFGELDPTLEICDAFASTSWTWAPRKGFEMIDLRTATWDCNPLAEGCDRRLADYGTECTDVTDPGFDPIEYLDLAAKTLEIASIPDDLLNNWYRDLLRDIGVDPKIGGPSNAGLDALHRTPSAREKPSPEQSASASTSDALAGAGRRPGARLHPRT